MIWIDDLVALEPAFLRSALQLPEYGISPERLALALSCCQTSTRAYILEHIDGTFAWAVERTLERSRHADPASILAAQLSVIGVFLWPIVYRRFPEEYEKFVLCQCYRFDQLFPPALYSSAILLDIGCGTGKLVEHLSIPAGQIYAIDPSIGMLRVARAKYKTSSKVLFAVGSFRDIPFPDETMDFVVSNMAFRRHEHCGGNAGLRSMKRVLRRGGEIHLTVENSLTQEFLLANGFDEDFVPLGLRYEPAPENSSTLLRCLITVAERGWGSAASASRAQSKWRLGWTISNLLAVATGASWGSVFHHGRLTAPVGVPIYRWRKVARTSS
jgi:SAM-dependent methyltransferase